MMSLPFLSAKLPLDLSAVVNYNEQSKIRQDYSFQVQPIE